MEAEDLGVKTEDLIKARGGSVAVAKFLSQSCLDQYDGPTPRPRDVLMEHDAPLISIRVRIACGVMCYDLAPVPPIRVVFVSVAGRHVVISA